ETSHTTVSTGAFVARISFAARSSAGFSMSPSMTFMPAPANACASPRPMPLAPPVMNAVFPSSSRMPFPPSCGSHPRVLTRLARKRAQAAVYAPKRREVHMTDVRALGFDAARLERVAEAIGKDIAAQRYDGAALRVHRRGKLALDIVQGYAHRERGSRLANDAVFVTFSSGKQFTAVTVLKYIEKGLLQLHQPVVEVIPEFAGNG